VQPRPQSTPRNAGLSLVLLAFVVSLAGCAAAPDHNRREGSGHVVLTPLPANALPSAAQRRLVYVPVYSSVYLAFDQQIVELGVTLSIRNVSPQHPLVIHSVKYFDSAGRLLREYVPQPASLAPMATADFVIQRRDTSGGPGANFLVDWSSAADVDEPVIESVMIGQHGNAGISFTSPGRPLPKASAAQPASR
jgi:hypothetical protein